MKPTAHIENWVWDGYSIIGTISKHPRQEQFKAEFQRTSEVVCFDVAKGIAETRNTVYTLGKPYVAPGCDDPMRCNSCHCGYGDRP